MIRRTKQWIIDRLGVTRIATTADGAATATQETTDRQAELATQFEELRHELHVTRRHLEELVKSAHDRLRVADATMWAANAPLRHEPTIGIVLPTHDRAPLLPAALDSVRAQTYGRWHLVAIDDGSTDDTAAVLASAAAVDDRITVEHIDGVGAASARNIGLGRVDGDFVTFLDDDNVMHPGWLRAIAEYTGRVEGCDAMFGAQLREDHLDETATPRLWFEPSIKTDDLCRDNAIDLGALAVRNGHPELHFDESLRRYIDWEMIVRIMASTGIDPVPVLASIYTTQAGGTRISDPDDVEGLAAMRTRLSDYRGSDQT
jgi:hypothetical protein